MPSSCGMTPPPFPVLSPGSPNPITAQRVVSIAFRNGRAMPKAVNSSFLALGLQGKLEEIVLAETNVLGKKPWLPARRDPLEPVSANSAADLPRSLGATINKTFTTTSTSSEGGLHRTTVQPTQRLSTGIHPPPHPDQLVGPARAPPPCFGLIGTTDSRLARSPWWAIHPWVLTPRPIQSSVAPPAGQVGPGRCGSWDVNLENGHGRSPTAFAFRLRQYFIATTTASLLGCGFGRSATHSLDHSLAPNRESRPAVPRDLTSSTRSPRSVSRNTTLLASPP